MAGEYVPSVRGCRGQIRTETKTIDTKKESATCTKAGGRFLFLNPFRSVNDPRAIVPEMIQPPESVFLSSAVHGILPIYHCTHANVPQHPTLYPTRVESQHRFSFTPELQVSSGLFISLTQEVLPWNRSPSPFTAPIPMMGRTLPKSSGSPSLYFCKKSF